MQSALAVPLMTSLFEVPMMTFRPDALQNATGSPGDAVRVDCTIVMSSSLAPPPHAAMPPRPNATATTIPFAPLFPISSSSTRFRKRFPKVDSPGGRVNDARVNYSRRPSAAHAGSLGRSRRLLSSEESA